jgi:hypothetical protein
MMMMMTIKQLIEKRKVQNIETHLVELISSRCTWGGVKKLREENRGG